METFKDFIDFYENNVPKQYDDLEVANLYFRHYDMSVRKLGKITGKSIGEVYRIVKNYGYPNRTRPGARTNVINLADSGLSHKHISNITGYTPRHIRNILKERT